MKDPLFDSAKVAIKLAMLVEDNPGWMHVAKLWDTGKEYLVSMIKAIECFGNIDNTNSLSDLPLGALASLVTSKAIKIHQTLKRNPNSDVKSEQDSIRNIIEIISIRVLLKGIDQNTVLETTKEALAKE